MAGESDGKCRPKNSWKGKVAHTNIYGKFRGDISLKSVNYE